MPTNPPRTLTPLQQKFVAAYAKNGNAAKAYVQAGGKPKWAKNTAWRLLKLPHIQQAVKQAKADIARTQARRADQDQATHDWIIEQLRAVIRSSLPPSPGQSKGTARNKPPSAADLAATVRALDVLGKSIGIYRNILASDFRAFRHWQADAEYQQKQGEEERIVWNEYIFKDPEAQDALKRWNEAFRGAQQRRESDLAAKENARVQDEKVDKSGGAASGVVDEKWERK